MYWRLALYLRGADSAELEAVAAVGEQRGAVAVLGRHLQRGQHRGAQVQSLHLGGVRRVLVI